MAQDGTGLKEQETDTAVSPKEASAATSAPPQAEPAETELSPKEDRKRKKGKKHSDMEPKEAGTTYVPGEPKKGLAEKRRILKERRLLRKDLKSKGVKSRKDFNAIAKTLGLELWHDNAFFLWLRYFWDAIKAGIGLKSLLMAAAAVLAGIFLVSVLSDKAGSFTINLTADMLKAGFILSETKDFDRQESRLFSEEIEEVNNITLSDIDTTVDEHDGPHNGQNYVAYTFYIKNTGKETASYAYYLRLNSETMAVSRAVWLMLFEDGRQIIYAQPTTAGTAEELYGFRDVPFADSAYDYEKQYYEKDGKYGIVTTPYAGDGIVVQGIVRDVEPGDVHKYTVVIWIEGYDPDCTDAIFGGYAKYAMDFEKVGEEKDDSIFSGVYRTEYADYNPLEQQAP